MEPQIHQHRRGFAPSRHPPKNLENWRSQKRGPRYHKSGKRVVYRVTDLEAFMAEYSIATIDQPLAASGG